MSRKRKYIIINLSLLLMVFCVLSCAKKDFDVVNDLVAGDEYDIGQGKYYVSPLAKEDWYDENVLNYSQGYFTFPPPAGYRLMRYSKKGVKGERADVDIDLFRETIDVDSTFAKIIKRRQGSDHCKFAAEQYSKKNDIDVVLVEAECYRWQSGEFKRRYYFMRNRNLVYTFRMTAAEEEYQDMASEFDHFVDYTVVQYMQYPEDLEGISYQQLTDDQLDPELLKIFNPPKKE